MESHIILIKHALKKIYYTITKIRAMSCRKIIF